MGSTAEDARDTLTLCAIGGAIGAVLGLLLLWIASSGDGGGPLPVVGWIVLVASGAALVVALVGWGVYLGMAATGRTVADSSVRRVPPASPRATSGMEPLDPPS